MQYFLFPGLAILVLILTTGFTIYYIVKSRHLERMYRIEHGMMDPINEEPNKFLLNWGIFLFSLGAGFLSAYMMARFFSYPVEVLIPSFLLLFGGIGLIVAYIIGKNKDD